MCLVPDTCVDPSKYPFLNALYNVSLSLLAFRVCGAWRPGRAIFSIGAHFLVAFLFDVAVAAGKVI